MGKIIIDAGPLVALLDKSERLHRWTLEELKKVEWPLITCEAVLSEACFLLERSIGEVPARELGQLFQQKRIISHSLCEEHSSEIFALMHTYRNVPMSFADACLVRLIEAGHGSAIFTFDGDFTIYRQHRRRIIPLIAPF